MRIPRFSRLHAIPAIIVAVLLATADPPAICAARERPLPETLKVALLPILDAFPFHVAQSRRYFSSAGLKVEAVPVGSGLERDQLMQAGAVDGMLNEMTSTANFNRESARAVIVAAARRAQPNYPLFRLLASPGSGIKTARDLADVPIGVSKNTIIEYVTDRLMSAAGVETAHVVKKSVPVIPERYQLLLQGRLRAATLPDPLAKSALAAGAVNIIDDSMLPGCSISVLTFGSAALERKPEAVKAFLKAWDRAAADINAAPEAHRTLLLKSIRVPENIQKTYQIPPFARGELPTVEQWNDMMKWMVSKKLLPAPLPYAPSFSSEYLPAAK